MAQQIQLRRGTEAAWTAANPTLAAAELGIETDTDKFKIGDGLTAWATLTYYGSVSTADVATAGALMDSEVTSLSGIKSLTVPDATTVTAFGATLVADVDQVAARSTLGVPATTDVATTIILTAAEYSALTPDPETIYYIVG